MARPVFATMLPLMILVPFLLFQICHCSSRALLLLPTEEQQPLVPTFPPAAHHRDEPPYHPGGAAETGVAAAIAEGDGQSRARADGGDGAAPSSILATAASPRDKDLQGGVVVASGPRRSVVMLAAGAQPQVLQRSELARRFLLAGVVEGGDSAARASCHSSDVHNGCTPPSEH